MFEICNKGTLNTPTNQATTIRLVKFSTLHREKAIYNVSIMRACNRDVMGLRLKVKSGIIWESGVISQRLGSKNTSTIQHYRYNFTPTCESSVKARKTSKEKPTSLLQKASMLPILFATSHFIFFHFFSFYLFVCFFLRSQKDAHWIALEVQKSTRNFPQNEPLILCPQ